MFGVISNDCEIELVEFYPTFSVICSVGKAPFHGVIEITFIPAESLLEFESFEAWLRSIATESFTIESFCREVYDRLAETLRPEYLRVKVNAETMVHGPASAQIQSPMRRFEGL